MDLPPIILSRKFQGAFLATVMLSVPFFFNVTDKSVSRPEKQAATEKYILAVAGLWGLAIGGTAVEDYAKFRDGPALKGGPPIQISTGDNSPNTAPPSKPGTDAGPPPEGAFKPILTPAPPPPQALAAAALPPTHLRPLPPAPHIDKP